MMGLVDQTKLCCGPFCAECHSAMESQDKELATLESQLSAEREAVRALGDRVNSCEHMLACYRVGRRPSDIALDTARETADAVDNNPIARAAVEKAGKHV